MQNESNAQQPSMFEQIMAEVNRGRNHKNQGTSMGLPKLESVIDGVTKNNYTLIISNSGSGKTSLALYSMVYRPLMEHLHDNNFKVLYVSLEMSAMSMFIKLMSIYIFEKFGKKLSYKEILSRKKGYVLDEEGYKMVQQCKEFVEAVENKIEFYDKNVNASSLYAILCDRLEKMGTFTVTETRKLYTPNNPDLLYLIVIDHIALIRPQNGHTLKQEIDLTSSYLVTLREMCGISPVVIQQTNRDNGNIERYKAGKSAFTLNDAKDSGNTVNDCNQMLAVFDPFKEGLKTYRGYDIEQLGERFRVIMVLKNRFGESNVEVGVNFFGEINYFMELPTPDKISDYSKYQQPDYITQLLNTTLHVPV